MNTSAAASAQNNLAGSLWVLCGGFFLVLMGTSAKMIGDDISLWQIMAIRQLVLLLFLIPLFRREGRKCFQTNVLGLHLLRVLFAAVALVCGLYAVRHLSLADATVIGFSKVMFATVAAWLLFGEGVGIRRALATTVGFAGVVVVVNPSGDAFNLSGLVAVAGAAGAGVVVNILRKLAQRESTERMILYQASLIGLMVLPFAVANWVWASPEQWLFMVLVGVFSLGSQRCNITGYRLGETSFVVPMDYFRLFPATLIGLLYFGEQLTWYTVLGATLIIGASLYTTWREIQLKRAWKT
ncbi:MAG: DMT family transporter [Granulosicoccaceae bacterium]